MVVLAAIFNILTLVGHWIVVVYIYCMYMGVWVCSWGTGVVIGMDWMCLVRVTGSVVGLTVFGICAPHNVYGNLSYYLCICHVVLRATLKKQIMQSKGKFPCYS